VSLFSLLLRHPFSPPTLKRAQSTLNVLRGLYFDPVLVLSICSEQQSSRPIIQILSTMHSLYNDETNSPSQYILRKCNIHTRKFYFETSVTLHLHQMLPFRSFVPPYTSLLIVFITWNSFMSFTCISLACLSCYF
jgi:hypothetical protein